MLLSQYTKEFGKNFSIAYPIIAGQVAHLLVALADNIMVGKLGAAALASVSLGNTLIFIALSIGIGFSFAITPLVAEADGKRDINAVKSILQNGMLLCIVNGLLLVILLLLAEPILYKMDQPVEVVELAIPYMRVVAFSLIPLMFFQALKQFSDGLSLTRFAMYATLIANVINIGVNYLLIYGEYGFPRLEVVGAAYGTLISRLLMALLLFLLLLKDNKTRYYFTRTILLSKKKMVSLLNIGLPTALQMFFEVSLFTAAIFLSGVLGTNVQAANQIALNLSAITFMVGVGLSVTATIRVGNQLGSRDHTELIRIARSIFLMALILDVAFAMAFYFGRDLLPQVYIDDPDVIVIASSMLIVAAIFQVSDGIQVVVLGALRGLQDVWVPSLICFVAYACIGFPIAYYFGSADLLGGVGIWIGLLSGLTISAILMYVRFRILSSRLLSC
ncbi:MATE family efflux transporter [Nonlabens ponticola]|uniref:Multidrug-efflux transporter n=1 Tax=Nonlabens ponticola TaxID=2496866 RepID=A0A3S9MZR5_9FLAO|nr:MATE family efflux transporter [Nonlabens ponticola]AZQ44741.1 MATE family efflux transporter [Nonlabens ponticola]